MLPTVQIDDPAYTAARTGAAFFRVPDPGVLRLTGADRRDYVQRQTTNDIRRLGPDRPLLTVLTSGTARIVDLWWLIEVPEAEAIDLLTLPGRGARTAAYLTRRIFFMDQVALRDTSGDHVLIELRGPQAPEVLRALGSPFPAVGTLERAEQGDLRAIGVRADEALLILPGAQADAVQEHLRRAGALPLSAAAREVLRVEDGYPGPDRELTEDYTPLEANLDALIAGDKGCYSGQEVLARQVTYDKIARRLTGLRCAGPVSVGADVRVEGRAVGSVTSAVESPRLGWIALAVLRRPHHAAGTGVAVGQAGAGVQAETVALPFV